MAAIARAIGVHRSTVKRELDRNTVDGVYNAHMALIYTAVRKTQAAQYNLPPERYKGQVRQTAKRIKRKILSRRRKRPGERRWRFPYKYFRVRFRKDFRLRLNRRYSRKWLHLKNRRWYYTHVRVRNYILERINWKMRYGILGYYPIGLSSPHRRLPLSRFEKRWPRRRRNLSGLAEWRKKKKIIQRNFTGSRFC
jgi:hypothetical protein